MTFDDLTSDDHQLPEPMAEGPPENLQMTAIGCAPLPRRRRLDAYPTGHRPKDR
jgi:hypothetical protein